MAGWGAAVDAIFQAINTGMNAHAQHKANRTNIMLARENRKWATDMANSEVQRRANDIEWAGGNRALAFTQGQSASTPTVSTPHVEAAKSDVRTNFTAAALAKAQIANINADTVSKLADAKMKTQDAELRTKTPAYGESKINEWVEKIDQDDLKTKIMRNQDISTAAEAERVRRTVDQMVQMATQQARTGELDLAALENVAKVGGLEASRVQSILKLLLDAIRTAKD